MVRVRERRRRDLVVRARWMGTPLPLRRRREPEEPHHLGALGGRRGPPCGRGAPAHPLRRARPRTRTPPLLRPPLPGRVRRLGPHAAHPRRTPTTRSSSRRAATTSWTPIPASSRPPSSSCAAQTTAASCWSWSGPTSPRSNRSASPRRKYSRRRRATASPICTACSTCHPASTRTRNTRSFRTSIRDPRSAASARGRSRGAERTSRSRSSASWWCRSITSGRRTAPRRSTTTTTATSSTTGSPTTSR